MPTISHKELAYDRVEDYSIAHNSSDMKEQLSHLSGDCASITLTKRCFAIPSLTLSMFIFFKLSYGSWQVVGREGRGELHVLRCLTGQIQRHWMDVGPIQQ